MTGTSLPILPGRRQLLPPCAISVTGSPMAVQINQFAKSRQTRLDNTLASLRMLVAIRHRGGGI
jgi:hypothetical protein